MQWAVTDAKVLMFQTQWLEVSLFNSFGISHSVIRLMHQLPCLIVYLIYKYIVCLRYFFNHINQNIKININGLIYAQLVSNKIEK